MLHVAALAAHVVATGYLTAEVGVAHTAGSLRGVVTIIYIGIVAQAVRLVELQHEDAATPGTIRHPQFTFLVIEDAGVDAVGPELAVVRLLVAGGKALLARGYLVVGLRDLDGSHAPYRLAVETAHHHGPLVGPGTGGGIAGEQHDDAGPVVSVQAHVEAPFLHLLVEQDVGSPHAAVYPRILVFGIARAIGFGIEIGEINLHTFTILYLGDFLHVEGIGMTTCRTRGGSLLGQLAEGLPVGREGRPRHEVAAGGYAQVGTPHDVLAVTEHHGGVVDADGGTCLD